MSATASAARPLPLPSRTKLARGVRWARSRVLRDPLWTRPAPHGPLPCPDPPPPRKPPSAPPACAAPESWFDTKADAAPDAPWSSPADARPEVR